MKKLLLTGVALLGFALGVRAAAVVNVNNYFGSNWGLAFEVPGNYFAGGPYTLEVWYRNTPSISGNINNQSDPLIAHNYLFADGYTLAATYHGNADWENAGFTGGGTETGFGNLTLAIPTPPPNTKVAIGLAVWNSSSANWLAAIQGGATHGGVITLANPVVDPDSTDPIPDLSPGWNDIGQDLIMVPIVIPEPGAMALAGLGATAFLITRRGRSFTNFLRTTTFRNKIP